MSVSELRMFAGECNLEFLGETWVGEYSVQGNTKMEKKETMHEKYTVIRNNHCLHQKTKESNRKSNKRQRDGQRTSSALTPYESVHCEQHNAQFEFPVNQSSQLPSTTSRHRASLAQDRKHVTSCLTQPQPGTRTEIQTMSALIEFSN